MFITTNLGSIAARGIPVCLWAIGAACLLAGCASPFDNLQSQLRSEHEAGQFVAAAKTLDEPASKETFGDRNQLLWMLDRGGVGLAINDMPTTIRVLEDAEQRIDAQWALRPSEQAAQWLLNDTVVPYVAPPYEDIYVNVFKLMAQLELGRVDGGATVEARRMANKSNLLRDRYLREEQALKERAGQGYAAAERAGVATRYATPTGGEFIESPLGTYLAAITFMKTGDREFQRVAGKRLLQAMEAQPKLFPDVNRNAFANVGDLDPSAGNVLMVALTGCGPYLEAERVGPMAIFSLPVYFELPRMKQRGSRVVAARIEVQDQSGTVRDGGPLELVENIGSVAEENFRRELPLIYQRTMVRYLVKAGATVGASEVVAQTQQDNNTQWLIRSLGGLIGLAVLGATERADLRYWEFLPAKAFVGLTKLPPGAFRVRTVYLGVGNVPLGTSTWREVSIPPGPAAGQLATVVQTTAQ
ncbi:MAG: hypothetical protein JSS51_02450 [Planctomycetes bacterium]|nr:hypothetical protein [Planctomycetota bacterium]